MDVIVLDPNEQSELIWRRRDARSDHHDEVWDGDYVLTPLPDNEHQEILWDLHRCFSTVIQAKGAGKVRPGANVTDQVEHWEQNYRCPDVVVFLNQTAAQRHSDYCFGGPDFVVEVISRFDRSRKKIPFYAYVGVRELLLIDRYPWALELYRLIPDESLEQVGRSDTVQGADLVSQVLPVTFQLVAGDARPQIAIKDHDGREIKLI